MPQAAAPITTNPCEQRDMPMQVRAATLQPATFNEAENTVEVVWTQGATVRRYDWYNDRAYEEALDVSPESVDMSRFDAGTVQVLDGHRTSGGVAAILGIAERGWLEGGEGRATLRLSTRPELAGIVADIRAGVIRAISFGYSVQRYEITRAQDRTDGINIDLYRATRWQPQEISFVTVPADAGAGTRAAPHTSPEGQGQAPGLPCEFVRAAAHNTANQEHRMPQSAQQGAGTPANTPANPATTADVVDNRAAPSAPSTTSAPNTPAIDGQRAADIVELCQRHGMADLTAQLLRDNASIDQARAAILDRMDAHDAQRGNAISQQANVRTVRDEHETRMQGMGEAIMHRMDPAARLTDNGRQYRGLSLVEMARESLEGQGVATRGLSRNEIASRAFAMRSAGFHTTGDFPALLGGVGARRLRAAYDLYPSTFQLWARRAANLPDFRIVNVLAVGGAPELKKLNEAGEYTYGTISEDATGYRAFSYGRAIALTRHMFVNDDLGAFDRLLTRFGESARRLENRLVYEQLTSNPSMQDGKALFHADHNNLQSAAGSALALDSLKAGRAAMRKQKDLDGKSVLNISPAYLLVPADLEQLAYQLTSSNYVPAKMDDVNEFRTGGRTAIEPIVEPLLDESSSTAWYMAARPGSIDTVEYAYVDGSEGVRTETFASEDIDGVKVRATLDFAAKVIDWRGLSKANGA